MKEKYIENGENKMGNTKKKAAHTAPRKTTGKRKKKKQDAYVQAIIVMIFSILLAVLIYGKTGTFGKGLSLMLGGLMGWIKYIVPVGAFVVGIVLTRESKEFVVPKLIQFLVIILCVSALMSCFQISGNHLNVSDDFGDLISRAYDLRRTK